MIVFKDCFVFIGKADLFEVYIYIYIKEGLHLHIYIYTRKTGCLQQKALQNKYVI